MFKIEIKHRGVESSEIITIGELYSAHEVLVTLFTVALDKESGIEKITLRNLGDELLVTCSF